MQKVATRILPVIVIAQFFCTSLWFAGNVIVPDLAANFNIAKSTTGHIIAAVQFGFITGTLVYTIFLIADRFRPSAVFFCSAILAALSNLLIAFFASDIDLILLLRFLTGFF